MENRTINQINAEKLVMRTVEDSVIAAVICSGVMELYMIVLSIATQTLLIEVFLVALLGVGIYRKSRVCAVAMCLLFPLELYVFNIGVKPAFSETVQLLARCVGMVMLYHFFKGAKGCFDYHKIKASFGKSE